jgi:formylglycine-generating enzyme required for sulfatase activity
MKPIKRLLLLCALGPFIAVSPALGQTAPGLGLRYSAGHPTLTLTGQVGSVYSIQYATGLSPTNLWTDRTLLQMQGASVVWTDPSAPTASQRFYRAVFVSAPGGANLVFVQPGTFTMGSPVGEALRDTVEVQHAVTLSRGFWMGKYLVTQGDYLFTVGSNPSQFTPAHGYSQDLARPVEQVSWNAATNYCALRTQQERAGGLIPAGYVYRLPTESEWEYACRAGTTTAFCLGSGLHSGQANFWGLYEYEASVGQINNPGGIYLQVTTPVGSYAANAWGLYDMVGNVWEWCQDLYGPYPSGGVTDPQGAVTGSSRVLRGGSLDRVAVLCRSAQRSSNGPLGTSYSFGFRVVLAQTQ